MKCDSGILWRAAFDCTQGRVFHLYGFPDDESGFSNLMKALDLCPHSESDSLVLASDFLRLTYRESIKALINDELDLMAAFARDYKGRRNGEAFNATWRKCPTRVKREIAPPSSRVDSRGYEVTLFTYVDGSVTKISLFISRDGTISTVQAKKVFQLADGWPGR
jgi:hypothetical protein